MQLLRLAAAVATLALRVSASQCSSVPDSAIPHAATSSHESISSLTVSGSTSKLKARGVHFDQLEWTTNTLSNNGLPRKARPIGVWLTKAVKPPLAPASDSLPQGLYDKLKLWYQAPSHFVSSPLSAFTKRVQALPSDPQSYAASRMQSSSSMEHQASASTITAELTKAQLPLRKVPQRKQQAKADESGSASGVEQPTSQTASSSSNALHRPLTQRLSRVQSLNTRVAYWGKKAKDLNLPSPERREAEMVLEAARKERARVSSDYKELRGQVNNGIVDRLDEVHQAWLNAQRKLEEAKAQGVSGEALLQLAKAEQHGQDAYAEASRQSPLERNALEMRIEERERKERHRKRDPEQFKRLDLQRVLSYRARKTQKLSSDQLSSTSTSQTAQAKHT